MTSAAKITQLPVKSRFHPETADTVLSGFGAFQSSLANDPGWLRDLRSRAYDRLRQTGLPTPKLEPWKFTNLIPAVKGFGDTLEAIETGHTTVPGITLLPLAEALTGDWVKTLLTQDPYDNDRATDDSLWQLGNLYLRDGAVIDVPANSIVAEPLTLTFKGRHREFYAERALIRLGANARLTIIEDCAGQGAFWLNRLSQIVLSPGARLTHIRLQEMPLEAVYTQATHVTVDGDAVYNAVTLTTGARLSRNQTHIVLGQPGAVCHVNGASLLRGQQHGDTTVLVEHHAPNCESNQNMRTILADQAHGVFQGKIHVHQPAQKTSGYQLSKALILSEGAEMDTKPELEIYADDVKCSHGATTGRLDDEPLFYLRSRGLDEQSARALLIEAFANDVLELVGDDSLQQAMLERVRTWLAI